MGDVAARVMGDSEVVLGEETVILGTAIFKDNLQVRNVLEGGNTLCSDVEAVLVCEEGSAVD
jgi:hypothetical protein